MENKKFFGWKVMAGCFLISIFVTGVISNPISLYMAPICASLGISTSIYSLSTLAGTIIGAFATMVWAPKMQKGNMKMFMIICAVITGGGYMLYALAKNVVVVIVASCIYNIGFVGMTQMPIALLMTMWFNKNRATYMSIAYAGGGIGGAIWAQVVSRIIATGPEAWRTSFIAMGALAMVAGILIVLFLIKKSPYEIGQTPYEGKPGEEGKQKELSDKQKAHLAAQAEANSWQGVTKGVALKSGSFWFLGLVLFCIGVMAAGVSAHTANYLTQDLGWTTVAAGNVVSIFTLAAVAGTIVGGVLLDRLGPVGGVAFACVTSAIGLVSLLMAGVSTALAFAFACLYGLGQMMPKMVPAILVNSCFGQKDYAAIFSLINFIFLIGAAFGSTIIAIIANAAGYKVAWIVVIVLCVVIFLASSLAIAGGKKLRAKYPNEAVAK